MLVHDILGGKNRRNHLDYHLIILKILRTFGLFSVLSLLLLITLIIVVGVLRVLTHWLEFNTRLIDHICRKYLLETFLFPSIFQVHRSHQYCPDQS